MRKPLICISLAVAAFASGLAFAASETIEPRLTALEQERHALWQALTAARANDQESANTQLEAVISAPAFSQLEASEKHQALITATKMAAVRSDVPRTRDLIMRTTAMNEATAEDWSIRLYVDSYMKNGDDAALAMTTLLQRWPQQSVSQLKREMVYPVAWEARKTASQNDSYFNLLQALRAANWKGNLGAEPNLLWNSLAQQLLDRNQPEAARAVASHITSPYYLMIMRADKRFDALVKLDPEHYNVAKAATLEVERLRQVATQSPRSLEAVKLLTEALMNAGKLQEAVDLSDAAIKDALDISKKTPAFDDGPDYLPWVMDERASALFRLGQWDTALRQMTAAARRPEHGTMNVSQSINLGDFYLQLGRPADALTAIEGLLNMSSVGLMELQAIRYEAAILLHDTKAAETALAYLREHQADDNASTYQAALIGSKQLDAAAKVFLERLDNPVERGVVLGEIQKFPDEPMTDEQKQFKANYDALLARSDIQAAVNKVGRILEYKIRPTPTE